MNELLKDELYSREIGGPSFVQEKKYISKIYEIITHNKVTTNQSTGEREEHILHLIEDGVSSEEKIMIALKEGRDNNHCDTIG